MAEKRCKCGSAITPPDSHTECVKCLGVDHAVRALSTDTDCPDCDALTGKALRERRAVFPFSIPPEVESEEEEFSDEDRGHAPPSRAAGASSPQKDKPPVRFLDGRGPLDEHAGDAFVFEHEEVSPLNSETENEA